MNTGLKSRGRLVYFFICKHTAEVGSVRQGDPIAHVVSMFTNKELWSYRLSVRTLGFHPKKRGSIPRSSSKFMSSSRNR